jgi:hypothetical protein
MKTYEIYHTISYKKLFTVKAKDLDDAKEKVMEMASNQGDYRDYDMEDDVCEA